MQVGNQVSPNSRSVGQRIKEASLKENVQFNNSSNNNGIAHASSHNLVDGNSPNLSNFNIFFKLNSSLNKQ